MNFLNEAGVITAAGELMRLTALTSIIVSVAPGLLTRIFSGDRSWRKYVLIFGLVIECGGMVCALGHNVTLETLIIIVLSQGILTGNCQL